MRNPAERINKQHYWLYGRHAALAALNNPQRLCYRLLLKEAPDTTLQSVCQHHKSLEILQADQSQFTKALGKEVVHQGIALLTQNLREVSLEELVKQRKDNSLLLILDQVTDPHNVGAILRSAAAFEVDALIMTHHHAPSSYGVIGKAASGGLEHVKIVKVTNLARTLDFLKSQGFWCLAMDGEASQTISSLSLKAPLAVVMGAEGKGLRRLTQMHCDLTLKIPTSPHFSSLNVSNAAAISLFAIRTKQAHS